MTPVTNVRIDKWLWAVRVYKSRSLAAEACRGGGVSIAGQPVKPSRDVKVGDVISAKAGEITKTIKVLGLIERRVGAQAAREHAEDLTPASEYAKARETKFRPFFYRPKGMGRPTKKEGRALRRLGTSNGRG
ncbi:MAG: RNA-binding S4 domain-containing protein [Chloroflexi bacterium]|nr:RNA-binding S4 domain-containing protein [Chloroflexota bacterium]